MFVRKYIKFPFHINKETINVDIPTHVFLSEHGYSPISYDKETNQYVYINKSSISSLIKKFKKGGDIVE